LLCRLQVELGVGPALLVGGFKALAVADGDEAVLKAMAILDVVVGVVGGDEGDAQLTPQRNEGFDPGGIAAHEVLLELEIKAIAEPVEVLLGEAAGVVPAAGVEGARDGAVRAAGEGDDAVGVRGQQGGVEPWLTAVALGYGARDEVAEVAIASGAGRKQRQVRGRLLLLARNRKLNAGDGLEVSTLGLTGETEGAAEIVVVGEREGGVAQVDGARDQLLDGGGALLEREVAVAVEFDVVRTHGLCLNSWLRRPTKAR